jgi:D-3-phosphoglycerate dehydrogenase
MDKDLRSTTWKKLMGNLLHGKKVGIVGFGRIGQQTATLLLPFGVELSYCDMDTKTCSCDCSKKKLEDILAWADIITLHISTTAGCEYLIGEKELQLMKENSWLVNVARGGVVDEAALYNELKKGHLAGAAIDVFEHEPYDGPLKELDNTIITPHIGSYAKEGRIQMEIDSVKNLLSCLEGENG